MILIQSLLWLLASFFLGYGIGRWLKGLFCKHKQTQTQTQTKPQEPSQVRVPVTTAAVATGGAAAALARSREPVVKPTATVKPVETPAVTAKVPEVKATVTPIKSADVSIPTTVELKTPAVNTPEVTVNASVVTPPNVDVTVPKPVITAPTVDVKAPAVSVPDTTVAKPEVAVPTVDVKTPVVDTPSIDIKDIATGVVGLGAAAMSVAAVKMNAPDGEVDLTVGELVKDPDSDVDLKTLEMTIPKSQTDMSVVELRNKDTHVDTVTVNVPDVAVDLANTQVPHVSVGLTASNLHTPEGKANLTALTVDTPDTAVHLPDAGIDTEHAQVAAGRVELNTPSGLYTLDSAQVQPLDSSEGTAALRLTKPDGDVQVANLTTDANGELTLATNNSATHQLQSVDLGSLQTGLVNKDWLASLKAAALAQGNTILAGAADQALAAQASELVTTEIGSVGAGLNPAWLASLKQAITAAGLGELTAQAKQTLGDLPKPVDESDLIEDAKTLVDELDRSKDLVSADLGTVGGGLDPAFLGSLKTAAAATPTTPANPSVNLASQAAPEASSIPKPVDESDLIEGAKTVAVDLKRHLEMSTVDIGSIGGLSADFLAGLKAAAAGAGIAASLKVANDLSNLPQPVDASDLIEGAKTVATDLQRTARMSTTEIASMGQGLTPEFASSLKQGAGSTVAASAQESAATALANQPMPVDESDLIEAKKSVVDAVLSPANLSVTELGTLGQGLNAESLNALKLAATAGTISAIQSNLAAGTQPMIVDESDAIEAIKLAWDGELSPAELSALQHTLILRPGETGRLGTVTCSVPIVNCVALGGLEGELNQGDAVQSKLFNMAVTHNDDGNYVFASLSKWLPDWIKSSDYSDHTSELATLVWDHVPSDLNAANFGDQLVLREGEHGNLGLVSCAVNEQGSISLGGIVGNLADGQSVLSKLYGIVVERTGDVYTFKQYDSAVAKDSSAAATAVGAGVAVAALGGAANTVKDMLMPVTKSEPTDILEPDLDWNEDKIRIGVHRLIAESQDRRGSKLVSQLWDGDSGYDCGVIEGEESLVLKPGLYGKLGSVHCGVTKPGRVVVSGDVSPLAEGEGVLFHLYNIVVCRDDEDNYRFERLKDMV
jgi:hypothetical protein